MQIVDTYSQRTLDKMIEAQISRWQANQKKKYKKPLRPVITISRLPGSKGWLLGKKLSDDLKIDFFDRQIVEEVAKSAKTSKRVVETMDEHDQSLLKDWLAALSAERHLWPYEYLQSLTQVIGTIGAHGHAVILGRGASYILPKEVCLRVLTVAPFEVRIRNVVEMYKVTEKDARQHVINTESDRKAFIRRYFHADLLDSVNYDMVINTEFCTVDMAVEMVKIAYNSRKWHDYSVDKLRK